jgi:hypothetical protein
MKRILLKGDKQNTFMTARHERNSNEIARRLRR